MAKPTAGGLAAMRFSLPQVALIVIVVAVPLGLIIGGAPLGGRTRLPLLEQLLLDRSSPPAQDDTRDAHPQGQQQVPAAQAQPPLAGTSGGGSVLAEPRNRRQKCAIYNGVNYHLDVTAGLAWAFQEAGCDTNVYAQLHAFGLRDVFQPWFKGGLLKKVYLEAESEMYDLIILVTFPEGPVHQERQNRLLLSRKPHQRILLAIHNPGWLLNNAGPMVPNLLLSQVLPHSNSNNSSGSSGVSRGTAAAGAAAAKAAAKVQPVQLLALAPINSAYAKSMYESWLKDMQGWNSELEHVLPRLEVPWIVPLVPWAPSDEEASSGGEGGGQLASSGEGEYAGKLKHLCIQGTIDPKRRNYDAAFEAASHPAVVEQLRRRKERLLLVGAAKKNSDLPSRKGMERYIRVLPDLGYTEYYDTLSRCRAILTAFGSDQYLINKTSSTMAAALQVGTPVLAEDRVLDAYEYVPRTAAFPYDDLPGAVRPDPAALAAVQGVWLSQWMQQLAYDKKQAVRQRIAPVRRAMFEGAVLDLQQQQEQQQEEDYHQQQQEAAAEQEQLRREAAEEAEEMEQEGAWGLGPQAEGRARRQQREEEKQQRADSEGSGKEEEEEAEEEGQAKLPPARSYAAAMLRAFNDADARAAHTAAWRAKWAAMRRNADVALKVLQDTAALAAAVKAARDS